MEYHTYETLFTTINRQYPIKIASKTTKGNKGGLTDKQKTDELYNQLLEFANNPNFNKIKTAIVPEVKTENKDDIQNYVYKS